MKKARIFFTAAAMLLVTAGVFAGKEKFQSAVTNLYYTPSTNTWVAISTSGTFSTSVLESGLTSGHIASLESASGKSYELYTNTGGSTYVPVYNVAF